MAMVLTIIVVIVAVRPKQPTVLATATLADGRILRIEGISFGTNHVIGERSFLADRFGPWLPNSIVALLKPKSPQNRIELEEPVLVVWVNALDARTGRPVDCQGLRVEFSDEQGDLFGDNSRHWYGGQEFWRVGHTFTAYPRTQRQLTLRVTPWDTNVTATVTIPNPNVASPAAWTGKGLPQRQRVGEAEVVLNELKVRTNGSAQNHWETPTRYLEPVWELYRNGQRVRDEESPDWFAEDPSGNRAQMLGTHQPVLRFTATYYPSATNQTVKRLALLPTIVVTNLQSIVWWNVAARLATTDVRVLGIFPPGIYVFSDGNFQTNPPVTMGYPFTGGSPSGWVRQSKQATPRRLGWGTPIREEVFNGHYTPSPTIYVRLEQLPKGQRIAIRWRDDQGRSGIARLDDVGVSDGRIEAHVLEIPAGVTSVTAEAVILEPVKVSFDVDIASFKR